MSEEVDRNDPELKYLSVERNQFNDPATQAEWTQKRLVWVPHENQVSAARRISILAEQPLGLCKLQLLTNTVHTTFHMPSTQKDTHTHTEKYFSHLFTYSHSSHLLLALFGFHRAAQKSPSWSTWKTCRAPCCVAQALAAATFYSCCRCCCCCWGTCCCWARVWPVFFFYFLLSSLRLFLVRFVE